jgi:hypothetical protein
LGKPPVLAATEFTVTMVPPWPRWSRVMRRTASRQDQPDDVDVEDSTDAGLLDVRYQVLVDRRSAADLTMPVGHRS